MNKVVVTPAGRKVYLDYNVVVAKYNENVDWINYLDKSKIVIYDKSNNPIENSISRPNIGRDPETFLYHIIENYDNLPDYLIFLQGNPFDHFTHEVNKDNLRYKIDELINSNIITAKPFFTNIHEENANCFIGLNFSQYYSFLFDGHVPEKSNFAAGCQYIVSKENILYRPKEFYKYIYNMICNTHIITVNEACFTNNEFDINHMSVWTLERLLFYIFNKTELSSKIKIFYML